MITNILDSKTPYNNQATEVVKTAHVTNLQYNYNTIVGMLSTYTRWFNSLPWNPIALMTYPIMRFHRYVELPDGNQS